MATTTMARVAMLAHVKESTVVEPPPSRAGARIPWTGGKIVSNKDEALRKFYERKLRKGGDALSPDQRRALEASLAKLGDASSCADDTKPTHKSKQDAVHKTNATAKRMAVHRKVSGATSKTKKTGAVTVVNGRMVGPPRKDKASAARGPKPTTSKNQQNPSRQLLAEPVALHDKLSMSLDALVKRRAK